MTDIKIIKETSDIIVKYAKQRNDVVIHDVELYWKEVPKPTECWMWMPNLPAPRIPELIPEPQIKPF